MTLFPNTPLSAENVGLLKAGDVLRSAHHFHVVKGATAKGIVTEYGRYTGIECRVAGFTYIGPDLGDGWIGWSGGENPVPGMRVRIRTACGWESVTEDSGWDWTDSIIAFRPALSPPAEGESLSVAAGRDYWAGKTDAHTVVSAISEQASRQTTPTPAPVDHIGDATEIMAVDWARCQRCGGEIQGWICQQCHQEFEENDAGELVFCPSEGVDWTVVGPKLVEALKRISQGEVDGFDLARDSAVLGRAIKIARAALAAAQPEAK